MKNIFKNVAILTLGVGIGATIYFAAQGRDFTQNLRNGLQLNIPSPQSTSITQTKTVYREQSEVINVVRGSGASVVSIAVKRQFRPFQNRNPFLEEYFGAPQPETDSNGNTEDGIGTGFVLTADGVILTNRHVVDSNAQYVVITNNNQKYDVVSMIKDPFNDLAILKVNSTDLKPVTLGDSDSVEVGQTAVAMGNALGEFTNTVTVGIVSGLNRNITAGDSSGNREALQGLIQTDAAINPGNSGGPLLNLGGQVIGINTAVASGSYAQNIGFAIPINKAKPLIDEYIATGKISRPYLGVSYRMLTQQLAVYYDVPEGAYLFETLNGGPAANAGLREGDIITAINNQKLSAKNDLAQVIRTLRVGEEVEVKYYRDGNASSTRVTVGEFPE